MPVLDVSCTHLVAMNPTGDKYFFALKWGVKVVNVNWFKDSVAVNARMGELGGFVCFCECVC